MNTRVLAAEDAFVNNSTECSTSDSNNDDDSNDDDDSDDDDDDSDDYDSDNSTHNHEAYDISISDNDYYSRCGIKLEISFIKNRLAKLKNFDTTSIFRTDLGICCSPGEVCCIKCAENLKYHRRSNGTDAISIERCASGLSPVGVIAVYVQPAEDVRNQIIDAGLEILVDGVKNQWGVEMFYFARRETADKHFSDFVNLSALRDITGVDTPDYLLRTFVTHPNLINDFFLSDIIFGFPMWRSIAVYLKRNECATIDDDSDDDDDDSDSSLLERDGNYLNFFK